MKIFKASSGKTSYPIYVLADNIKDCIDWLYAHCTYWPIESVALFSEDFAHVYLPETKKEAK